MTYDRYSLEVLIKTSSSGKCARLGSWKPSTYTRQQDVFAISEEDIDVLIKDNNFYVLYDDGNKIIQKVENKYKICGELKVNGEIDEYFKMYIPKFEEKKEEEGNLEIESKNETKFENGNQVEDTLRQAREMTIESLLEGFDYGL